MTLDGATVTDLFRQSIEVERRSSLEFSGVTLEVRLTRGKPKLVRVLLESGEELQADAQVRLTTNSYLAGGGDGWEALAGFKVREVDFLLLRDLLEFGFAGGARTPSAEQRYKVLR
jgi:2',3'-cyclic-nucleotide 2'-phosphodiesterase (5'-nucleotidase family)